MEEELAAPAISSPVAARLWGGQRGGSSYSGVAKITISTRCWLLGVLAQHKEKEDRTRWIV
ncbi:hypothetical protein Syun_025834 [Stephania yunnanensis]|uniref:Uncharacterized protein n=1 Tax=Stephania yunnanensis TaxID=152371 RepID=A0AAP0HVM7_9MAGN